MILKHIFFEEHVFNLCKKSLSISDNLKILWKLVQVAKCHVAWPESVMIFMKYLHLQRAFLL